MVVTLNKTAPEPSAENDGRTHLRRYARRHILIVDDDPVFSMLASETLLHAGFDARIAQSVADAVAAFDAATPDLILLDVALPGGNGFDLCERWRSHNADLPIVMVTGSDDTQSIARAYEVGATDFIQKPVLWPTLPHRLGFILRAVDNLQALRKSETKNAALVQALPDAIFVIGTDGYVAEHITGLERRARTSHVGKPVEQVFPAELAAKVRRALGASDPGLLDTYEFKVREGDSYRWLEARLRRQADGPLLVVIRDNTERRRAKDRIEYLAYFDVLTKLPNRLQFVREATRAMHEARRSGSRVALLYLDLDRFKRINDNLGHSVGDTLLRNVARRLEQCLRQPGDGTQEMDSPQRPGARVARLGGDEFVVLLPGVTGEEQASEVAERITNSLGEPFDCGGHHFVVTPSIGIAMFPTDATDVDDLLAKADMAMYQAKEKGRNGHAFFGQSMAVRSLGRLEIEGDLRRAFEGGEFLLHYQPKLDLATGALVGVEALLRWPHPQRGFIPPDTFIPVAEETGLIVPLGDWVIAQAARQLKQWASRGYGHLTIAVNASVQQFSRLDFVDSVLRTLRLSGVPAAQLEIEITESLLAKNVDDAVKCLRRFREAGIAVSIDDFGTGYSSLGYLRQFPIDALKIDRSFVKDLHQSDDDAAICAAIIAMARELKLRVIAEGVENEEQLAFLKRHRCDQAQGYFIGRPVPVETLDELLAADVLSHPPARCGQQAPGLPAGRVATVAVADRLLGTGG